MNNINTGDIISQNYHKKSLDFFLKMSTIASPHREGVNPERI